METSTKSSSSTDLEEIQAPVKQQTNISSFFISSTGSKKRKITDSSSQLKTAEKKSSSRILLCSTAEKWKSTSLAKYNAEDWLVVNTDAKSTLVTSMNCAICQKFEERITSIKGFNYQWLREGSKRLLLHAAVEHAEGQAHKRAYDLHLKSKSISACERTDILQPLLDEGRQRSIMQGLGVMQMKDFELTKKKFETAYFVAKEEIPLAKFSMILELEDKHGVVLGNAYRNNVTGGCMIDYIADNIMKELKE